MKDFRCTHCRQLQFKYTIDGDNLIIEVKCYACNQFSKFAICLNRVQRATQIEDRK